MTSFDTSVGYAILGTVNATFQFLTGLGHWIVNQLAVFVVDHELTTFRLCLVCLKCRTRVITRNSNESR